MFSLLISFHRKLTSFRWVIYVSTFHSSTSRLMNRSGLRFEKENNRRVYLQYNSTVYTTKIKGWNEKSKPTYCFILYIPTEQVRPNSCVAESLSLALYEKSLKMSCIYIYIYACGLQSQCNSFVMTWRLFDYSVYYLRNIIPVTDIYTIGVCL